MYTQAQVINSGEQPPSMELLQLITAYWGSQAVWVFAKLGIADLLKDGPETTVHLAVQTRTHEESLYRLLRALASLGMLTELDGARFELKAMGACLRSDVPGSMRTPAMMFAEPWFWNAWGGLLHSVNTGQPAFDHVFGMPFFRYLTENLSAGSVFDAGMTVLSAPVIEAVVQAVDLSQVHRIVDIGGGEGSLVIALLHKNPHLRGIVFDLPSVINSARAKTSQDDGVGERIEFVGGSFLESVPEGGDVYILKSVLHNWSDSAGETVLKNCRRAINPGGELLIIERVLPARVDQSPKVQAMAMTDLHMMVTLTGGERTEDEFRDLLQTCGFSLERVTSTKSAFSILNAK